MLGATAQRQWWVPVAAAHHLFLRVNVHDQVQERLVQEGHPRLHAPGEGRLVGPQHVPLVQPLQQPHRLPETEPSKKSDGPDSPKVGACTL